MHKAKKKQSRNLLKIGLIDCHPKQLATPQRPHSLINLVVDISRGSIVTAHCPSPPCFAESGDFRDSVKRLRKAIIATIASPMIGSIEDYTWEAIFHYIKDIPLSDPALGRSKLLYDAVDLVTKTGWSLKSLQLNRLNLGSTFFFVIQRADIIKKAIQLGFTGLTEQSSPNELGSAIIQHWNEKIISSQVAQSVVASYESIFLKTIKGYEYIYCEFPLHPLDPNQFTWAWTVDKITGRSGAGLQGSIAGKIELVWYKNQKQLFRARTIPTQAVRITVDRTRLTLDRYVETVISALEDQIHTQFSDNEPE